MRPLLLLLRLQTRGTLRRLVRGARTPRGAIFLLLGAAVLVLWLGPSLRASLDGPRVDPALTRQYAPLVLLAFTLATLVGSAADKAVTFTPAEIDFLFPGPFGRRQLLGFKMLKSAAGALFSALFFSIILLKYASFWPAVYVGAFLTLLFVQLFSMSVVLVGQSLGARSYTGGRKILALVVAALLALPLVPTFLRGARLDGPHIAATLRDSPIGRAVLAPFGMFASTITADAAAGLLRWGSAALAIDLSMLALIFWLDAQFVEASIAGSKKVYERLRRIRRGGLSAMHARATSRWRLWQLPRLGGAGTIAWRQLSAALRSSRGILILLVIMAVAVCPVILSSPDRHAGQGAAASLVGIIAWLNIFFASMLKFDFRDEIDHMDWLKSLPLRPAALALGELVAPVVVMTGVQVVLMAVLAAMRPALLPFLATAFAFLLPFNLLLFGVENALFLLFPTRTAGLSAGDLQMFGRQSVLFVLKLLAIGVAAAVAAVGGAAAWGVAGKSWPAGLVAAWVLLMVEAAALIPVVAWTFGRFDPSSDTPA